MLTAFLLLRQMYSRWHEDNHHDDVPKKQLRERERERERGVYQDDIVTVTTLLNVNKNSSFRIC